MIQNVDILSLQNGQQSPKEETETLSRITISSAFASRYQTNHHYICGFLKLNVHYMGRYFKGDIYTFPVPDLQSQ